MIGERDLIYAGLHGGRFRNGVGGFYSRRASRARISRFGTVKLHDEREEYDYLTVYSHTLHRYADGTHQVILSGGHMVVISGKGKEVAKIPRRDLYYVSAAEKSVTVLPSGYAATKLDARHLQDLESGRSVHINPGYEFPRVAHRRTGSKLIRLITISGPTVFFSPKGKSVKVTWKRVDQFGPKNTR